MKFNTPTALEYFATLVADDDSFSLVEAAAAIAQDDYPELDTQSVLEEIDTLAVRLKGLFPADAVPVQRLHWLNRFFFQKLGFAGNVNDYHHPDNSYVHRVLATRRGIPVTLAVVYLELATQIGLKAQGISFPGHFLVKMRLHSALQEGEVVIDPFTGQSLSREALEEMLAPYKQSQGFVGDLDLPLGAFLQAASARDVVARMLRNLKGIHQRTHDAPRLLQVLNRLVILLPTEWQERRDRGIVQGVLGLTQGAIQDLEHYLEHVPHAPDRESLEAHLAELRLAEPPNLV